MSTLPICDKCGRPVSHSNSAVRFDKYLGTAPSHPLRRAGQGEDRHIWSEDESCEGSPSRRKICTDLGLTGPFDTSLPWDKWPVYRLGMGPIRLKEEAQTKTPV